MQSNGSPSQRIGSNIEIIDKALKQCYLSISVVPPEFKTDDVYISLLRKEIHALWYIDIHEITINVANALKDQHNMFIEFISGSSKYKREKTWGQKDITEKYMHAIKIADNKVAGMSEDELYRSIVLADIYGWALAHVPEQYLSEQLLMDAVRQNGINLRHIRAELRTESMIIDALNSDHYSYRYIDSDELSVNIVLASIKHHPQMIRNMSIGLMTPEFIQKALMINHKIVQYLPLELLIHPNVEQNIWQTINFENIYVKIGGLPFDIACMCAKKGIWKLMATDVEQMITMFSPEEVVELFHLLVANNGMLIQHMPKKYRTIDLLQTAVRQNGLAVRYIDDDDLTEEIIIEAIMQNAESIRFVDTRHYTPYVISCAIDKNKDMSRYIPDEFLN